jgi:long-chain acyl-CoA synthetase
VGSPLPGVELRILDPQEDGVGEVAARAPGVMAGYYKDEAATSQAVREGWLLTGDLGRLDADGRLHLVGRLKDLIIGADGKNVHPDELEAIYFSPEVVKEMCVAGIGDGNGAERIACLAVPAYERHPTLARAEVRALVEEHFRGVSATLPAHKRVRLLELWDGELPRTATRKPKRREVVALLERLRDESGGVGRERGGAAASSGNGAAVSLAWTIDLVARVSGRPRREIQPGASLEEMGFDSLTYAELEAALEEEGLALPAGESAAAFRDLRELTHALRRADGTPAFAHGAPENGNGDLRLPAIVSGLGRRALSLAQGLFYGRVLDTEIAGQSHLPAQGPFIVAANHASHLDAGLVRTALGRAGDGMAILAAADYFFDTRIKRLVFSNFTDMVPFDRNGSAARSVKAALELLRGGRSVLIFPEGTRSRNGHLQPFQRGVGHLALQAGVGVVPVYLSTHNALPVGSIALRERRVSARIGPFLSPAELARLAKGQSAADAERRVAAAVQSAVEALGNGSLRRAPDTPRPAGPAARSTRRPAKAKGRSSSRRAPRSAARRPTRT